MYEPAHSVLIDLAENEIAAQILKEVALDIQTRNEAGCDRQESLQHIIKEINRRLLDETQRFLQSITHRVEKLMMLAKQLSEGKHDH
jgi:hypothetical protein